MTPAEQATLLEWRDEVVEQVKIMLNNHAEVTAKLADLERRLAKVQEKK